MRKIIIAGNATFYKEAFDMKKELESKGNDVIDYPRHIDDSIEVEYKLTYERFYDSLSETDDLL